MFFQNFDGEEIFILDDAHTRHTSRAHPCRVTHLIGPRMSGDMRSNNQGYNGKPQQVQQNLANGRSGDDGGRMVRPGDWICLECRANNFAVRTACHNCRQSVILSTVRATDKRCAWMVEALQATDERCAWMVEALQKVSQAQQETIQALQKMSQAQQEELRDLKRKSDQLTREKTELTQERDDLKQSISAVVYKDDTFIFTDQREPMKQGACGKVRRGKHVNHDYGEEKPKASVVNGFRLLHYRQPTTWHRDEEVVIKTPKTLEFFEREKNIIEILMKNEVQGVPKSCCYGDEKVIVMKYCGETLWEKHRSESVSKPVSLDLVCDYGLQMVEIVERLHKVNVLHNDIKLENVTKTNNGTINLIDFGESILLEDGIYETDKLWSGLHRSLNHHSLPGAGMRKLSGVDDLWSVYFVLLDLVRPAIVKGWRRARDKVPDDKKRKVAAQVKKTFVEGNDKCAILQVLKGDGEYPTKLAKFKELLEEKESKKIFVV